MRERVKAASALLVASVILAGCSGASGVNTEELTTASGSTTNSAPVTSAVAPSSPAASPSSSSTVSSSAALTTQTPSNDGLSAQEAADRAAVEAQWDKFWDVYLALPHTPAGDRQAMAALVAIDPGFTSLLTDANTVEQKGWDSYGQIVHRISWPQPIDGQSTAVIADCQDTSQAGSLETSTGNKTTVGVQRNSLQGKLVRGQDGVWRVEQAFYLKDEPC